VAGDRGACARRRDGWREAPALGPTAGRDRALRLGSGANPTGMPPGADRIRGCSGWTSRRGAGRRQPRGSSCPQRGASAGSETGAGTGRRGRCSRRADRVSRPRELRARAPRTTRAEPTLRPTADRTSRASVGHLETRLQDRMGSRHRRRDQAVLASRGRPGQALRPARAEHGGCPPNLVAARPT
jgi:hypothetical protein